MRTVVAGPGGIVSTEVIGCSAETSRCSDARDYRRALRPCCRAHVVELSALAADALRSAGIPFWMDYGTLLGAVRNPLTTRADYPWLPASDLPEGPLPPGIIPHDKDADWGVPGEYFSPAVEALRALVKRSHFTLLERSHRGSLKLRYSQRNETNLDLFFWYPTPTGHLTRPAYILVDQFKGREFKPETLFPLTTLCWESLELPAPVDLAAWCLFRYGETWQIPVAANHDGLRRGSGRTLGSVWFGKLSQNRAAMAALREAKMQVPNTENKAALLAQVKFTSGAARDLALRMVLTPEQVRSVTGDRPANLGDVQEALRRRALPHLGGQL